MATAMRPTTTHPTTTYPTTTAFPQQSEPQFAPKAVPASFNPYQVQTIREPRQAKAVYIRRQIGAVIAAVVLGYMAWMMLVLVGDWFVTTADAAVTTGEAPAMTHVVESGDTLWSIATGLDTDRDVRDVVASLREANGGAADLQPGQVLNLRPAYG